jgi:iron(II)-dependent oxidoreductase
MSGNVWQWTRSLWGEDPGKPQCAYPYNPADGREDPRAPENVRRVVRGGSFGSDDDGARAAGRSRDHPGGRSGSLGFRVVVSRSCS